MAGMNTTGNTSMVSLPSIRATAVEVCNNIYGDETPESWDAIVRLYEANAIYENPLLTATSRSVLDDIYKLSTRLSDVRISTPTAMFYTLFRFKHDAHDLSAFNVLRVWTEMGDICETESFDGHRKSIIEHTLNILLLPEIHTDHPNLTPTSSTDLLTPHHGIPPHTTASHPISPSLRVPGTSILLPSPLHLQLHIITRLSFNEQGRITHHRDFCDIKDVLGLIPGMSLMQWVTTRLAAYGLTFISRKLVKVDDEADRHALPFSTANTFSSHQEIL